LFGAFLIVNIQIASRYCPFILSVILGWLFFISSAASVK
jgi:hypothetical protein